VIILTRGEKKACEHSLQKLKVVHKDLHPRLVECDKIICVSEPALNQ
jgi:hypothetical protein